MQTNKLDMNLKRVVNLWFLKEQAPLLAKWLEIKPINKQTA